MRIFLNVEETIPTKVTPFNACCINGYVSYGGFFGQEDNNELESILIYKPTDEDIKNNHYYSYKIFRYVSNNQYKRKLDELVMNYNLQAEDYKNIINSENKEKLKHAATKLKNHLTFLHSYFNKKNWLNELVKNKHINHLIGYTIYKKHIVTSLYNINGVIAKGIDFSFGEIIGFDIIDYKKEDANFIIDVHGIEKRITFNNKQKDKLEEYIVFGLFYCYISSSQNWTVLKYKVFAKDENTAIDLCRGNHKEFIAYEKSLYDKKINFTKEKYLGKFVEILKNEDSKEYRDLKIYEVSLDENLNPLFKISGTSILFCGYFKLEDINLKEKI